MGLTITMVIGGILLIEWRKRVVERERKDNKDRERRIKP